MRRFLRNSFLGTMVAGGVLAVVAALTALADEPCPDLHNARPFASVIEADGWVLWTAAKAGQPAHTEKLWPRCALPQGAILRPAQKAPRNGVVTIQVVLASQERVAMKCECAPDKDCQLVLPSDGKISQLVEVLLGFLKGSPYLSKPAITTQGSSIHEGVVGIENGQVELASIFEGVDPGDYQLRFADLDNHEKLALRFTWDGTKGTIPAEIKNENGSTVLAGLYQLTAEKDGQNSTAWILLAPSQKDAERIRSERDVIKSQPWPPGTEQSEIMLLRAQLLHAAQQLSGTQ